MVKLFVLKVLAGVVFTGETILDLAYLSKSAHTKYFLDLVDLLEFCVKSLHNQIKFIIKKRQFISTRS